MNNMSKKKQTQSQPQSCLNCKFADYLKTRTGKLAKGYVVTCRFPRLTDEQMRELLKDVLPESMLEKIKCPHPDGMTPDWLSFGANCSQWKPVEGEGGGGGEVDGKQAGGNS